MKNTIFKVIGALVLCAGIVIAYTSLNKFNILGMLLGFILAIVGGVVLGCFSVTTSKSSNNQNQKNVININKQNSSSEIQGDVLNKNVLDNNSKVDTPKKVEKRTYLPISPEDLSFETTIEKYLTTSHSKCPCEYNYFDYLRAEFDCILNNLTKENITISSYKLLRQNTIFFDYEKSKTVNKNSSIKFLKDFIAIDVETTGLKTGYNDIIELSAIKFENFKPISIFSTLLSPRKPVSEEITKITGITNDMLVGKPKFSEVFESFISFVGDLPLVMHNASFDLKFLYVSGWELDFEKRKIYDTLELSRKYVKDFHDEKLDSYKLVDVCEEVSIYFNGAHRSSADALAAGLLFNEIVKIRKETDNLLTLLEN